MVYVYLIQFTPLVCSEHLNQLLALVPVLLVRYVIALHAYIVASDTGTESK